MPSLRADAVTVEAVVNTIGFPLVGGPAGTMEGGRQADVAKAILSAKNVPYTVAAPLLIQVPDERHPACASNLYSIVVDMMCGRRCGTAPGVCIAHIQFTPLPPQDMAGWNRDGIGGLQSVVLYSLPELDGAIDTVPLGGLVGDDIFLSGERVMALTGRLWKWINLRRKEVRDRAPTRGLGGHSDALIAAHRTSAAA